MTAIFRYLFIIASLSGLIHIVAILAIPHFAEKKVWQQITQAIPERTFVQLDDKDQIRDILGQVDPAMIYGLCWFDLTEEEAFLTAPASNTFWNVSLFNDNAQLVYSLHDAVSRDGQIDMEIRGSGGNSEEDEALLVIEHPNRLTLVDPTLPLPEPKPLTEAEKAEIREQIRLAKEEDPTIETNLRYDRAFAVVKMLEPSPIYRQLIVETLENANCS